MSTLNPVQKIFKNRSGANIEVSGVVVHDMEDFILPKTRWAKMADDYAIYTTLINSGDLIISDGISDLTPTQALQFLQVLAVGGAEGGFSWYNVPATRAVEIPINQQMITHNELQLSDDGEIVLDGEIVVIN